MDWPGDRVRATRSDKKIETKTRVVLVWNMEHSQDNGIHTSIGFEVSKATVIKINASNFKVVAVNSNWRSGLEYRKIRISNVKRSVRVAQIFSKRHINQLQFVI